MRLEARDLSIGYRGHLVGSDISLALGAGEVLCLLGPNGAGKTTLFRTLLGLQPPLGGAVLIDGAPLAALPPAEIARHLAYVPQAHVTEFSYSVLDVVLMGRTARLKPFSSPGAADDASRWRSSPGSASPIWRRTTTRAFPAASASSR
jgi:iron complex transport system ATP-binding protein